VRIDSFPFNDELGMLELRLGQLDEVVDKFVLVETGRTYSGLPKPRYYQENKDRFAKWNHKIVASAPELGTAGSWAFEAIQREVIPGLIRSFDPDPNSTLTFSDLDEIPNPEVIASYTPDMGLMNLLQWTYYYNFNRLFNYGERSWSRARIGTVQHMYDHGAVGFRGGWPAGRDMDHTFPSIPNGGWHGSYFHPTVDIIRRKVHSISHYDLWAEFDARTDAQIAADIHEGKDIYHRYNATRGVDSFWGTWVDTEGVTADHRLPPYFLANQERFKMFTDAHFVETNKHLF
jgi:beta-1,4-mannosyl-glycoprotein beta-1,4-N-acetylglucosaminyltransferase